MALSRRLAGWFLLAAGLAQHANAQVEVECGSASIGSYTSTLGASQQYADIGAAIQACETDKSAYPQYHRRFGGGVMDIQDGQGQCVDEPSNNRIVWVLTTQSGRDANSCNSRSTANPVGTPLNARSYGYSASCATRAQVNLTWTGGDDVLACSNGCEFSNVIASGSSACAWLGTVGNRVYQCAGNTAPTGQMCTGNGQTVSGGPPPDPDRDGDGTPNGSDEAPDDPACQTGCGPQDPDPEDPDPEEPDPEEPDPPGPDYGPQLDALAQALAGVTAAVNAGTAQANTNTQTIVGAIEALGGSLGGGDTGEPGDGGEDEGEEGTVAGGETCAGPPICAGDAIQCAIVQQAYHSRCATESLAQNLATWDGPADDGETPEMWGEAEPIDLSVLDDSGFGWTRSCPALPSVGFMGHTISADPTGDACDFLQLLSQLILLAGFAHAAYIVASKGRA